MLTIPWDYARRKWHGKLLIIQPVWNGEGHNFAWRGEIQDSYYVERNVSCPSCENPRFLRIRFTPQSLRWSDQFPNYDLPESEWKPCDCVPRLVVSARLTDLYVTENHSDNPKEKPAGDLWCIFNIPEQFRGPELPRCFTGWFVVQMGDMRNHMLQSAERLQTERVRVF